GRARKIPSSGVMVSARFRHLRVRKFSLRSPRGGGRANRTKGPSGPSCVRGSREDQGFPRASSVDGEVDQRDRDGQAEQEDEQAEQRPAEDHVPALELRLAHPISGSTASATKSSAR